MRQARPLAHSAEPLTLRTGDGVALAAQWTPAMLGSTSTPTPKHTLVVAAATGVPMGYYRHFASWAAAQGVSVLCFDYRGVGRSRPERLRGFKADFNHWTLDIDAAVAYALQRSGGPVSLLGHSIGGFLAPACEQAQRLHRLVLVGAQSAYWRDWPHPQRWPMALLWHGAMPAVTTLCGFFPGRALRLGEDLPRGVALQWALRPWNDPFQQPLLGARYARRLPPIHLVAASDDAFATDPAQQRVHDALGSNRVHRHRVEPQSIGERRLGHFGVFREPGRALWPRLLALAMHDQEQQP